MSSNTINSANDLLYGAFLSGDNPAKVAAIGKPVFLTSYPVGDLDVATVQWALSLGVSSFVSDVSLNSCWVARPAPFPPSGGISSIKQVNPDGPVAVPRIALTNAFNAASITSINTASNLYWISVIEGATGVTTKAKIVLHENFEAAAASALAEALNGYSTIFTGAVYRDHFYSLPVNPTPPNPQSYQFKRVQTAAPGGFGATHGNGVWTVAILC